MLWRSKSYVIEEIVTAIMSLLVLARKIMFFRKLSVLESRNVESYANSNPRENTFFCIIAHT